MRCSDTVSVFANGAKRSDGFLSYAKVVWDTGAGLGGGDPMSKGISTKYITWR